MSLIAPPVHVQKNDLTHPQNPWSEYAKATSFLVQVHYQYTKM